MSQTRVIILAAGQGKRMKSDLPKVLVPFMDKPMIKHVFDNSSCFGDKTIIVVGYKSELIMEELVESHNSKITFVTQKEQLGTGHAVQVTEDYFEDFNGNILILFGDSPLISKETLLNFINYHKKTEYIASVLTKDSKDPGGCARIIRNNDGTFQRSIENKDLVLPVHKQIKEINVGVMMIDKNVLFETLKLVNNNNSQNEYYLPDVINILSKNNKIGVYKCNQIPELFAFNTIDDLKQAESLYKI